MFDCPECGADRSHIAPIAPCDSCGHVLARPGQSPPEPTRAPGEATETDVNPAPEADGTDPNRTSAIGEESATLIVAVSEGSGTKPIARLAKEDSDTDQTSVKEDTDTNELNKPAGESSIAVPSGKPPGSDDSLTNVELQRAPEDPHSETDTAYPPRLGGDASRHETVESPTDEALVPSYDEPVTMVDTRTSTVEEVESSVRTAAAAGLSAKVAKKLGAPRGKQKTTPQPIPTLPTIGKKKAPLEPSRPANGGAATTSGGISAGTMKFGSVLLVKPKKPGTVDASGKAPLPGTTPAPDAVGKSAEISESKVESGGIAAITEVDMNLPEGFGFDSGPANPLHAAPEPKSNLLRTKRADEVVATAATEKLSKLTKLPARAPKRDDKTKKISDNAATFKTPMLKRQQPAALAATERMKKEQKRVALPTPASLVGSKSGSSVVKSGASAAEPAKRKSKTVKVGPFDIEQDEEDTDVVVTPAPSSPRIASQANREKAAAAVVADMQDGERAAADRFDSVRMKQEIEIFADEPPLKKRRAKKPRRKKPAKPDDRPKGVHSGMIGKSESKIERIENEHPPIADDPAEVSSVELGSIQGISFGPDGKPISLGGSRLSGSPVPEAAASFSPTPEPSPAVPQPSAALPQPQSVFQDQSSPGAIPTPVPLERSSPSTYVQKGYGADDAHARQPVVYRAEPSQASTPLQEPSGSFLPEGPSGTFTPVPTNLTAKATWKEAHPSARKWAQKRKGGAPSLIKPSIGRIALGLVIAGFGTWLYLVFIAAHAPLTQSQLAELGSTGADVTWRFRFDLFMIAYGLAIAFMIYGGLLALRGALFRPNREMLCPHCATTVMAFRDGFVLACPNGGHLIKTTKFPIFLIVTFLLLVVAAVGLVVLSTLKNPPF